MTPTSALADDLLYDYVNASDPFNPISVRSLYSEDATQEFPFAPPGFPAVLRGRSRVVRAAEELGRCIDHLELYDGRVHPTLDPEIFFATYRSRGSVLGKPYGNRYVAYVRMHEGRIAEFHEYFNPLEIVTAMPARARLGMALQLALPRRAAHWLQKRMSPRTRALLLGFADRLPSGLSTAD
ncbi:nuclear transport factor 2 family protein [Streptomyces sp. NPDC091377]|uniref:nuclear transport factor 2 family protein n=1 Tax=unclassified Streptomyces TaxID=2593676 RepID=UPI003813B219